MAITNKTDNTVVSGTVGDDDINNYGSNVIIYSDAGDDFIYSSEKAYGSNRIDVEHVTISGGEGNDSIRCNSAYTFIDSGTGDDSIIAAGSHNSIIVGDGNDTIINYGEYALIYANEGNDFIDNTIIGNYSTIVGGGGDDTINANGKGNVILYAEGDGNDVVENYGEFTLYVTNGNYNLVDDGKDLLVIVGNGSIRFLGKAGKSININDTSASATATINNQPVTSSTSTTSTVAPSTTTTATTSTVAPATNTVTSGNGGGDTIINNYYYDMSGNNGTIIINSNVEGDVTNNTNVDNSTTIIKQGDTYIYNGGNKIIENYQQGEIVELASDFVGIDLNGNSFYVKSSSGQLEIQNSRDKFIGYSAGGQVAAYSYVASGGGNIDGRDKSQIEMMIGADNADNQIYAGAGGSSLWGGVGGADILVGGEGYDEFFYTGGSGSDVIQNAGDNDLINLLGVTLEQISNIDVNESGVSLSFIDAGNLRVEGNTGVGYKVEETIYAYNQSTGDWYTK